MIKVNLLPQRKAEARRGRDPSSKQASVGVVALARRGGGRVPRVRHAARATSSTTCATANSAAPGSDRRRRTSSSSGFAELRRPQDEPIKRAQSIKRLIGDQGRARARAARARRGADARGPDDDRGDGASSPATARAAIRTSGSRPTGIRRTSGSALRRHQRHVQARGRRAVGVGRDPAVEAARGVGLLHRRHAGRR